MNIKIAAMGGSLNPLQVLGRGNAYVDSQVAKASLNPLQVLGRGNRVYLARLAKLVLIPFRFLVGETAGQEARANAS